MKAINGRNVIEAVDELKREIHVRNKCYPKWTEEGKLTRAEAAVRLESLIAALDFCAFHEAMGEALSKEFAIWAEKVKIK